MKQIYFDNAATTKVDDEVLKTMLPYFNEKYANASSVHFMGQEAKNALEWGRKTIAKSINAKPNEIIFTSGGTEANNLAIKGLFFANYPEKNHIITTKIDHDCVINSAKWLEKLGAKVTYLDVDSEGFVNPKDVENAITGKTFLVSVIHGNNEIGTIQDLETIGKICRKKGVLFHTDACQSFTKVPIDVRKQNIDLMTLNAHKIHGPKGVGALYIREGIKIIPIAHGGGHENKLRSGTENVSGIVGFAKAVEIAKKKDIEKMIILRDKLIKGLTAIPSVKLNGPRERRLCNNVNVSFNNIEGESVGGYLEKEGICTSTGSACASHSLETSHVLRALGMTPLEANSSIRISISKYTTEEEVDYFLRVIPKIVEKLRRISPIPMQI
ncbi:MAG TPA: cysteine desulfurase family protein [Patescibacteria group bacterium]|nr:cysteine desulfurase family protein [Patescibacteria group bacterium]